MRCQDHYLEKPSSRSANGRTADAGSAFYLLSRDLKFLFVSPQAGELWNRSAESLAGQQLLDVFPAAAGSETLKAHVRAAETNAPVLLEAPSPFGAGWLALSVFPGPAGLAVSFHDITANRRLEAERRTATESLRAALDAAEMGMCDLDLVSGCARRSPRHDAIFGYAEPLPEWTMATFLNHVLSADRDVAQTAFLDATATGGLAFECRITRVDGEVRWIAVTGRAAFGDLDGTDGKRAVRIISVVRDVTGDRHAQERLLHTNERLEERMGEGTLALADVRRQLRRETEERTQSEARFAAAFRLAPVPMVLTLLDGFRIRDMNEAFTATFGYTAEAAIGRTADDLKLWETSANRRQFEQDIRTNGRVTSLDVRLTTKSGWLLDCLISAEIVTIEGERHILSVLQDITERKRSEAELFAAIEVVMKDTSWFSRRVIEKLAQLRNPARSQSAGADLADLTPREQEALGLLCQGMKADDIAAKLGVSRNTVRNHLAALYQKIRAQGRSDAIIWARERGFTGREHHPTATDVFARGADYAQKD